MKLQNTIKSSKNLNLIKAITFAGYLFTVISCNTQGEKKIDNKQKIEQINKKDNKDVVEENLHEIIQSNFNKEVKRQIKADNKLNNLLIKNDFSESFDAVSGHSESLGTLGLPDKLLKINDAKYIHKKLGEICKNSVKKVLGKYKIETFHFELTSAFDETWMRGYYSYSNEELYIYNLERYISTLENIQKIAMKTK